jgi:hypothetical protein
MSALRNVLGLAALRNEAMSVTLKCARDSVCMGDDCSAPNPKTPLVPPSLTDPVALGELLG